MAELKSESRSLTLDPNPTPAEEAKDFESTDEKVVARKNAHELELLHLNQGKIGRFLGTTNTNLKIAFCIIIISGLALVGSLIGAIFEPAFFDLAQYSGTIMLTVAGYVFGVRSSD